MKLEIIALCLPTGMSSYSYTAGLQLIYLCRDLLERLTVLWLFNLFVIFHATPSLIATLAGWSVSWSGWLKAHFISCRNVLMLVRHLCWVFRFFCSCQVLRLEFFLRIFLFMSWPVRAPQISFPCILLTLKTYFLKRFIIQFLHNVVTSSLFFTNILLSCAHV